MSSRRLDMVEPTKKITNGEIENRVSEMFSVQMAELCMSEEFSDVSFEIQDEKIPAHVNILVTRSKYFRALLCGGFAESKQKVIQLHVPIEAFKALLMYIYSGKLSLSQMQEENILDTLRLANQYGCTELELSISEYLCEIISLDNVSVVLDTARVLGLKTLINDCHTYLDTNSNEILVHESFKNLSEEAIKDIIGRDTFCSSELQICTALREWCKHNSNNAIEVNSVIVNETYPGKLSLSQIRADIILDTLRLVNQCGCADLELLLMEYTCKILALDNVCAIFDTVRLLGLDKFQNVYLNFLDENANGILIHKSFMNLSIGALKDIICRDTLCAPEVQIFNAVKEWCNHNPNVETKSVVSLIRLSLMSLDELKNIVRFSGFFYSHTILEAINEKSDLTSLPCRKGSWKEENVVTEMFAARVIEGEGGSALLDGDTTSYNLNKGYAQHSITDDQDLSIIVELGSIAILNHIKLLLLDCDSRYYSYYIDVSIDKTVWERVVDYQPYHCRSWQFLYFPTRAVRYIKLVGTYGSKKSMFEVVSLEAYYTAIVPKMIDGIVAPIKNVATVKMNELFSTNSVNYHKNLFNNDIINYSINSERPCLPIFYGIIMFKLPQPYVIGSMSLILADCFDMNFSFYIETSINEKDWEVVVDKKKEACRSRQNLEFEPRAMAYIKIFGRSPGDQIFLCMHFECMSKTLNATDDKQEMVVGLAQNQRRPNLLRTEFRSCCRKRITKLFVNQTNNS